MSKSSLIFACSHCGGQYPKWQGQCGECGKWGTIKQEETGEPGAAALVSLSSGTTVSRLPTGLDEVDNVLGRGLVPGSAVLLAGDPGIGKSTLVLQMAAGMMMSPGSGDGITPKTTPFPLLPLRPADSAGYGGQVGKEGISLERRGVIYVCGEESPEQIGLRLSRLKLAAAGFQFLADTNVKSIAATIKKHRPALAIVDSIQTISDEEIESEAGTISQIRASGSQLLRLAKETNIPIIIIGHVTKDGAVAGPKALEHLVDVVLYLEGDDKHEHRLLRSTKNRFGPTNQVGVFTLGEQGLAEVKNPSELFLSKNPESLPGSVVSVVMEGSRPFLVEVQALTNKAVFNYPKRSVAGFSLRRLELITAVLSRRAGLKLENQDIFLNIVGGLRVHDPALDLAAALAIASSLSNQPMPAKSVALGELGLGGEVRPIAHLALRVNEAKRLGFEKFYAPEQEGKDIRDLRLTVVRTIGEGLTILGVVK